MRTVLTDCQDMTDFERGLAEQCLKLGDHFDCLWLQWYRRMVIPYHALSATEQKQYKIDLAASGIRKFDCTAFDYSQETGVANQQPWCQAFPAEIEAICQVLKSIVQLAKRHKEPELEWYFAALAAAYACTDISQLESRWELVDRRWICLPPTHRLVPIHNMEAGYDHPLVVTPEFILLVRVPQDEVVVRSLREQAIALNCTLAPNEAAVTETADKLTKADVFNACPLMRAGGPCHFAPYGRVIPARQDVAREGSKLFVEPLTMHYVLLLYQDCLNRYVSPALRQRCIELLTVEDLVHYSIVHDLGHFVGCTAEMEKKLGGALMDCAEEARASVTGVCILTQATSSETDRLLSSLVVIMTSRLLIMFVKESLTNTTLNAYQLENTYIANVFFETGVLCLTEDGLVIDFGKAKEGDWLAAFRQFAGDVLEVYQSVVDSGDISMLYEKTEDECTPSDQTNELIRWIANRPL